MEAKRRELKKSEEKDLRNTITVIPETHS